MARKKKDVEVEEAQVAIELAEQEKQEAIEAEAELAKEEAEAKAAEEVETKALKKAEEAAKKAAEAETKLAEAEATGDEEAVNIALEIQNKYKLELEAAEAEKTKVKEAKAKELQEAIAARVKAVTQKDEADLAYDEIPLTARIPDEKQKEKRGLPDKVREYKDESSLYGTQFYRV